MGRTAPVETHPAQRTRSGPGRSGPTAADEEPVRPALVAPVPVPGLLTGSRAEGRAVRRDVELRDISAYRKAYPVRAWVVENTDFTLRNVVLNGLGFTEIVGANVLLYEKAVRDPAIIPSLNKFLTSTLDAYRGIPIWHRFYRQAVQGTVQAMGDGPPDSRRRTYRSPTPRARPESPRSRARGRAIRASRPGGTACRDSTRTARTSRSG